MANVNAPYGIKRRNLLVEQLSCISIKSEPPPAEKRPMTRQELLEFLLRTKYKTSWRTQQLAKPKRITSKYKKPPDVYKSLLGPGVLSLKKCSARSHDLAWPKNNILSVNKDTYKHRAKLYKNLTTTIELSWESIYNYYKRCELKAAQAGQDKKRKSKDKVKGKSKEQMMKEFLEWALTKAQPKPVPEPDPLPPRQHAPLQQLMERGEILAIPKQLPRGYLPPYPMPRPIPERALKYEMTDQMQTLTEQPRRIQELANDPGPRIPGYVERGALRAKPTQRILELAEPVIKKKAEATDEKEDPFAISPFALKYVATERIKELAKPVER